MNAFTEFSVSPDVDSKGFVLRWSIDPSFKLGGEFFVQRSYDGVANFETVNSEPLKNIFEFTDPDVKAKSVTLKVYYRIVFLDSNGERHNSETLEPFYVLHPRQYAVARHIMRLERTMMSRSVGISLNLRKRKYFGEPADDQEQSTKTSTGRSLSDISYGTGIKGGYDAPITIGALVINRNEITSPNTSGFGMLEQAALRIRTISYPYIKEDDLLIDKERNIVYVVGKANHHMFKGVIPVVCTLDVTPLQRNDIRYKLV